MSEIAQASSVELSEAILRAFSILRAADSREALAEGLGVTLEELRLLARGHISRCYAEPGYTLDRYIAVDSHTQVFMCGLLAGRFIDPFAPDLHEALERASLETAGYSWHELAASVGATALEISRFAQGAMVLWHSPPIHRSGNATVHSHAELFLIGVLIGRELPR